MAAPDELFCWEGDWGLPSVSTDCLVVLAYAQFAGAPLKLRKICNPWRSPGGSLPTLKTGLKDTLSRPSDIIIHLRKQKYNADYDLSAKEGADSLAFISLMEEKLAPALIYTFWIETKNYVDVTRRWYAEHMPFPLNFFLPGRMQARQLEKLRLLRGDEGLEAGEDLEKELYRDAAECMNLLSQRLGSQKFFFGDSPSSLDAYVFGHLAPILKCKLPNGKLQQHLKSLDNLSNFCTNILLLYFPRDGREDEQRKEGKTRGGIEVDCQTQSPEPSEQPKTKKKGASKDKSDDSDGGKQKHLIESKTSSRRSWTTTEKAALQRQLGNCIILKKVPEPSSQKMPAQPEGGDFDNVPNKRRKQLLSALVALGAMLSYALVTGMVSIQHQHREALEEPPDLEAIGSHDHEEEGDS